MVRTIVLSLAVGIGVGLLYAVLKVKSPAPPIVALIGLLGIVIGEHLPQWYRSAMTALSHR